ncbi:MAG: Na+/H+ antiporter NhaA [Acidimicrobiia bacterium]
MHIELRQTWKDSDRFVPRRVVRPVQSFMQVEVAGGLVMLAGGILALLWANSPWKDDYVRLWSTEVILRLGDAVHLDMDLHALVNDGAMALFFLIAGLEIKRQLTTGELKDPRAAALPAIGALGGMLVPALIYIAFNAGHAGSRGWGIPVATDIAFAVGVVTLVGRRIPLGARIFLLTLAVVDDVGGIIIIAVAYAEGVKFEWLGVALLAVLITVLMTRVEVRSIAPYIAAGSLCWYSLHEAGVEAAIAGVIFGLLTPTKPFHNPEEFPVVAHTLVDRIADSDEIAAEDLARYAIETASPLERVENRLNRWVSFLIVPLFALANAGVEIDTSSINQRVLFGVGFGLVVGKAVGVFAFAWVAVKFGLGRLPSSTTWRHMFGLALASGIGFTVALFVTGLSFDDEGLTSSAKLGILGASALAGLLAYLWLRACPELSPAQLEGDSMDSSDSDEVLEGQRQ